MAKRISLRHSLLKSILINQRTISLFLKHNLDYALYIRDLFYLSCDTHYFEYYVDLKKTIWIPKNYVNRIKINVQTTKFIKC